MNEVYDKGDKKGSKATAIATLIKRKENSQVEDYLPVSTIKSYFSRRARKIRTGKITASDNNNDDEDEEDDEEDDDDYIEDESENEDADDEIQNNRQKTTTIIQHKVNNVPNLLVDDWVAVAFLRGWYPGQFIRHDEENGEIYVNFLEKTSSHSKTFTWPALNFKEEDKCWVDEGNTELDFVSKKFNSTKCY